MKTPNHNDPTLAKLVEKQMKNWELARSRKSPLATDEGRTVEPFICISRQVGTQADEVARQLVDRLGWPLFDRDILLAMADNDRLRSQIYASLDERDLNWCEETLRPLMQPGFVKNDYFHQLTKTILSLARKGSAIFMGRGADLILPKAVGLRVRIVAPLEQRIRQLAVQLCVNEEQAQDELERLDEERNQFISRHFGVDDRDPTRHDLQINLGRLTTAQATELILTALNFNR